MTAPDIFAMGGGEADQPATMEQCATVDFEPIDTAELLREGLSSASIQALAVDLRLAAMVAAKTKEQLVEGFRGLCKKDPNGESMMEMLNGFDDTEKRLTGLKESVEVASLRLMVAMSVIGAEIEDC